MILILRIINASYGTELTVTNELNSYDGMVNNIYYNYNIIIPIEFNIILFWLINIIGETYFV